MTQRSSVRLVPEEPVGLKDDALGFGAYAQTLADAARESVQPLTIGVFGDWGTGKSSLMRMVSDTLAPFENIVTVECNAWQFQHEDQPLFPLIASVIRRFDDYRSERPRTLNTLLGHLRQAALEAGTEGDETWPVVQVSAAPPELPERIDSLLEDSQYAKAFQLLSEIEVPGGWKFVVFVDDLDRCSPERAVRLLESIKLVLDQPGFVFVLGVSRAVIEEHLTHLYREMLGVSNFNGASYLEKLVQLPFPIPSHRDRINDLAGRLSNTIQEPELVSLLEMLASVFDYNPRALIRVVNNLIIDRSINENLRAANAMDKVPLAMFAVSRALQHRWPSVHRILELSSGQLAERITQWQQGDIPDPDAPDQDLSEDAAYVARAMRESAELRSLLHSDAGTAWLHDEAGRVAAAQFVRKHKREKEQPPMGESRMFDVYVSYPKENAETADMLQEALQRNGYSVFLDRASIGAGEPFQEAMEAALRTARALIFLIDQSTPSSTFQQQAAVAMLDRQGADEAPLIIPVVLAGGDRELLFKKIPELAKFQAVDLRREEPPYDKSMQRIAHALRRLGPQAAG